VAEIKAGDVVESNISGNKYIVVAVDGNQFWGRSQSSGISSIMMLDAVTKSEPFFVRGKKYRLDGLACCTYEVLEIEQEEDKDGNPRPIAITKMTCTWSADDVGYRVRRDFRKYKEIVS